MKPVVILVHFVIHCTDRDSLLSLTLKKNFSLNKNNFFFGLVSTEPLDCVKGVRPYSQLFWSVLFRIRHSANLRIQSECWKVRTRKTPNTNTSVNGTTMKQCLPQLLITYTLRQKPKLG